MIIYNVTIKVDTDVHEEWLAWMQDKHIPEVINTGLFESHKVCRLLGQDESEGITYAIQYFCNSMEDFVSYRDNHAPRLQQDVIDKFKDKFVAFRTLMEVVD